MAHGTPEQKQRHLPRILSCEEVWCQGFSEPGSGSDLASLRTRAELKGDHFIVNGQKVWTSYAHYADWCMLLARTDQSAPRHRGLSFLLVDMKTPGVTVKPLRQMTGEPDFNETFFDNVAVPRTNLLGGLNEGWRVAMTTLASERGAGGVAAGARFFAAFTAIAELCRHTARRGRPVTEDPLVRQQLAQFYVDVRELRAVRRVSGGLDAAPGDDQRRRILGDQVNLVGTQPADAVLRDGIAGAVKPVGRGIPLRRRRTLAV